MVNEKRLIDASSLMEQMHNHYEVRNPAQNATMDECCMMVFNAPTVDAVEVVHGEWLVEAYTADDSIVVIPYRKHQHNEPFCSRCQHHALLICGEYVASNYCPNCGAKMDGGNEDD